MLGRYKNEVGTGLGVQVNFLLENCKYQCKWYPSWYLIHKVSLGEISLGWGSTFKTLPLSWNLKKKHTMTRYLNKARYGFQLDILGFQTIFILRFQVSGSTSIAVESWSFFFTFQKQDKKLGPHFCSLIYFVLEVITLLFYKLSFFYCLLGSYCIGPLALLFGSSCIVPHSFCYYSSFPSSNIFWT